MGQDDQALGACYFVWLSRTLLGSLGYPCPSLALTGADRTLKLFKKWFNTTWSDDYLR